MESSSLPNINCQEYFTSSNDFQQLHPTRLNLNQIERQTIIKINTRMRHPIVSTIGIMMEFGKLLYLIFLHYGTGQIRTGDLPLRRRLLYPAELQPQLLSHSTTITLNIIALKMKMTMGHSKSRRLFLIHTRNCVPSG